MIRTTLRILGFVLLALGLFLLFRDFWASLEARELTFVAGGELWYRLHPGSLNLLQAGIQRNVAPEIWDPGIVAVLLAPASVILSVLGILLMVVSRRRRRRG